MNTVPGPIGSSPLSRYAPTSQSLLRGAQFFWYSLVSGCHIPAVLLVCGDLLKSKGLLKQIAEALSLLWVGPSRNRNSVSGAVQGHGGLV